MCIKICDLNHMFEDWWYGELKLVSSWFDDWCFEIFVLTMFWIISEQWEIGEKIMFLNIQMSEKQNENIILNSSFTYYIPNFEIWM